MHKVRRGQAAQCLSAMNKDSKGYVCQEADQHSQSAKRNTPGNRDNGTKQSAGISENRRRLLQAVWTRWPNCANMPRSKQRFSILAQRTLAPRMSPLAVTTSVSNSCWQVCEGSRPWGLSETFGYKRSA